MPLPASPPFSYTFAKDKGIVVLDLGDKASLGVREGYKTRALVEARRVLRRPLTLKSLSTKDFDRALSEAYGNQEIDSGTLSEQLDSEESFDQFSDSLPKVSDLLDTADDAPLIKLINGLIADAAKRKASDIHIEPFESKLSVRIRIDGVMQDILSLSQRVAPRLVSRIKVMARLDIAEKRVPQDGRISLSIGGKSLDVRVSTLPAQHGERVVLRLLDKSEDHFGIDQLGMTLPIKERFRHVLAEPNGIILVSGPTGAGKTTTLYAGLDELNDSSRNILTVEDPVEYALDGVGQTQVNTKVGMTFAKGLRALLRQDPDVVMVGEIRDPETASIAVQASLTGHLVLSTIHTNNAVGAITRLRDMGVEPFLLSSSIKSIVAQRLVRKLCSACKVSKTVGEIDQWFMSVMPTETDKIFIPKGCEVCGGTGYKGRLGLYELVTVDDTLRRMIHDDAVEEDLKDYAYGSTDTLLKSGVRHVAAGLTSVDEVLRVCRQGGDSDVVL